MPSRRLHLIAHDIRSTQNVGAILRTADSLGVEKVWFTGFTATPDEPKVRKTALGAEASVAWEAVLDIREVLERLRKEEFRLVGLEVDARAVDLSTYHPGEKTALLLGNENEGITPSLRDACDELVAISQKGIKESLNVSVATGIAAYWILNAE